MTGLAHPDRAPAWDLARLPLAELAGASLQALRSRKLRAALSALGIAIGIGAMVAVVGVSSSAQANLLAEIDRLGTNLLTVTPGTNFTGNAEILPTTATTMIGGMSHVRERCRRVSALDRGRAPHPVRPLGGDRRDRSGRRPGRPP